MSCQQYTAVSLPCITSTVDCVSTLSYSVQLSVCLIYLNARWGFSLQFGTEMWGHLKFVCEVPNQMHQTSSLWTRPCRAKPRPALQNCEICTLLSRYTAWRSNSMLTFWNKSLLQGSRKNPREHSTKEVNWHSLFSGGGALSIVKFF